jgi:hypothetical protein
MSIDWLFDLERAVDAGKEVFACPGVGKNQWVIAKSVDELRKMAQRSADQKKMQVNIVRLVPKMDAVSGDLFLVPVKIGDPGPRGEPQVEWKPFETREAGENMRDVRHGPSPIFGMQVEAAVDPTIVPAV